MQQEIVQNLSFSSMGSYYNYLAQKKQLAHLTISATCLTSTCMLLSSILIIYMKLETY